MISSCPMHAIRILVGIDVFPTLIGWIAKRVMFIPSRGDPSTLRARTGCGNSYCNTFSLSATVAFIKTPSAPESMRALRGTSCPCTLTVIGIRIDFESRLGMSTRDNLMSGEMRVHGFLLSKNPRFLGSRRTHRIEKQLSLP